jgi:hypothetical protein
MSLIVLLPRLREGLLEMESKLGDIPLPKIRERLDLEYLSVTLPRFKLESTFDFIKNKALSKVWYSYFRIRIRSIYRYNVDIDS